MGSVNSTWYYVAPWYYRLSKRMEGWLKSKVHNSLSTDRSVFYKRHSDAALRESVAPVKAGNIYRAPWLDQKPMSEKIRQGYF